MTNRSSAIDMESIAREHYDAVFRFCARRVGSDKAADISQETFLTAQKALHKFRGDSTLSTRLFGIANNECRRYFRYTKVEPLLMEEGSPVLHSESAETGIIDRHSLNTALTRLSSEHREVVILHEIEGFTYDEVAEILKIPAGTVKSRLHHAFLLLRKSLLIPSEVGR